MPPASRLVTTCPQCGAPNATTRANCIKCGAPMPHVAGAGASSFTDPAAGLEATAPPVRPETARPDTPPRHAPPVSALENTTLAELAAMPVPEPATAAPRVDEPERGLSYHEYIEAHNRMPERDPSRLSRTSTLLSTAMFYVVCVVVIACIVAFLGVGTLRAVLARLLQH